jgi:hypothetical protein
MDSYYGRRKRNIDLSRFRGQKQNDDNWSEMVELEEGEEIELEEGEEEYEIIDSHGDEDVDVGVDVEIEYGKSDQMEQSFFLDGKPFVPKIQPKKQSFADTHIRVTTYFEKNVHQIIRILQKQGQIDSITKFVNDSIKEYLLNNYNENK